LRFSANSCNDLPIEMKKPRIVPKEHPPAWQSPLWKHHELILSMRRRRHSYPDIAQVLSAEHGVQISPQSLRGFVVRWDKRKSERKPLLPSGWTVKTSPESTKKPLPHATEDKPTSKPDAVSFFKSFHEQQESEQAEASKLKPYIEDE
jgi:hypothetical protein